MPTLRYQHPAKGAVTVEIGSKPVTIGRSRECTLPIEDSMLSRKHCEVRYSGGKALLTDLQSKNGTFVNGTPVSTWQLKDGDLISIGNTSITYREGR